MTFFKLANRIFLVAFFGIEIHLDLPVHFGLERHKKKVHNLFCLFITFKMGCSYEWLHGQYIAILLTTNKNNLQM